MHSHSLDQKIAHKSAASDIRFAQLAPQFGLSPQVSKVLGPLFDRILGLNKIEQLYKNGNLYGLEKQMFCKALLGSMGVHFEGQDKFLAAITKPGPCIVVANHPLGGIEGVALAYLSSLVRSDTKVIANQVLKIFKEIKDFFIFVDPFKQDNQKNISPIRNSLKHLKSGGLLIIFPAGRVSYKDKSNTLRDFEWSRIVGDLAKKSGARIVPIHVSGENSPFFYKAGRLYPKLRLILLSHELAAAQNKNFKLSIAPEMDNSEVNKISDSEIITRYARFLSYNTTQNPTHQTGPELKDLKKQMRLADSICGDILASEINSLPPSHKLASINEWSVYFAEHDKIPFTLSQITRERERVFRSLDEGSGFEHDTDLFDKTYTHLFAFDHSAKKLIGAYRFGKTDNLLKEGTSHLYLSQMFDFKHTFHAHIESSLELGRSFIIPEYQRKYSSLLLLWKGLANFLEKHPRYRFLYGTVSISNQYSLAFTQFIKESLAVSKANVSAKKEFFSEVHPEISEFAQYLSEHRFEKYDLIEKSAMHIERTHNVNSLPFPILIKHYAKMGAKFHTIGVDEQFASTPGMLLSVDYHNIPKKMKARLLS